TLQPITRPGLPPLLQIHVNGSQFNTELPFSVTLSYGGGVNETVHFTIIDPPTLRQAFLPDVMRDSTGLQAATLNAPHVATSFTPDAPLKTVRVSSSRSRAPAGPWGPWTFFWAGSDPDQRLYTQMPSSENPPNNSGCWSGCGATAWAMIFGWADNQ